MRQCPNGHEVGDNVKYCPTCGAEIISGNKFCTKCGNERKGTEKFCSQCGTPFDSVSINNHAEFNKEKNSSFKKYLPYVIGAIMALPIIGYFKSNGNIGNDSPLSSTKAEEKETTTEDDTQAKKDFLEAFYKKYDSSEDKEEYIKSVVTNNALQILKKHYTRGEGGDMAYPNGLACWLFNYYNGIIGCGSVISRTITPKEGNKFLISAKYEDVEKYEVELSVIKEGNEFKIDNIEPVGMEEMEQEAEDDGANEGRFAAEDAGANLEEENGSSSQSPRTNSNTSSSSRTFYSEQIVIGYLANQSFRCSDGLTMRVDGSGRLYVDGDYAGVLSVLRYNSTSALLRYGGGMYGEGKLTVHIVGDKFTLTDPTDGTVYYQR